MTVHLYFQSHFVKLVLELLWLVGGAGVLVFLVVVDPDGEVFPVVVGFEDGIELFEDHVIFWKEIQ